MLSKRRRTRELAMQLLFLWESNGRQDLELADKVDTGSLPDAVRRAALDMARGAWEQRQSTDEWITRLAPQWPTHRQPPVDRSIMRLAVWELTQGELTPHIVIDEALGLARHYSTKDSPAFINGVLDALQRELKILKAEKPAE